MVSPMHRFPSFSTSGLRWLLCLALAAFSPSHVEAAEEVSSPETPGMREVSPGIYQIGKLRLDKSTRTISFPGTLNMNTGLLEYLLVTPQGSTHESLLVTPIQPSDLHFAMLLLGAKGAGITTPGADQLPPAQINAEYLKTAPELRGDPVSISVEWRDATGAVKIAPVEDWLFLTDVKKAAPHGPWIYTGSMFSEDRFLAQTEGIFASVVTNPSALINNPRKGKENDHVWEVNEKAVPPVKTELEIHIKLEPNPANP